LRSASYIRIVVGAKVDQRFKQICLWQGQQTARRRQARSRWRVAGDDRFDYGIAGFDFSRHGDSLT